MIISADYLKIHILTILAFFLGFLLPFDITKFYYWILALAVVYVAPAICTKLTIFSPMRQSLNQVFKYSATTLIFGVIDQMAYFRMSLISVYLIALSVYHYGQFQLINTYHQNSLQWSCFLLYHSKQYTIANLFAILEHLVTVYVFEFQYKNSHMLVVPGCLLMVIGLTCRLVAFYTAKANFTHLIQFKKRQTHHLVTNGIYKYIRHPSYFGYFYFCVGSMMFIGNFVCMVAYFILLWNFFKRRIMIEQQTLVEFFEEYESYRQKTPTLIPFIS